MRPHRSSASLVRGQVRIRCGTLFTAKAMAASRPVVRIKLNVGGGEGIAMGLRQLPKHRSAYRPETK
jgi:hypothetical protein